jgi:hypothetical protein
MSGGEWCGETKQGCAPFIASERGRHGMVRLTMATTVQWLGDVGEDATLFRASR